MPEQPRSRTDKAAPTGRRRRSLEDSGGLHVSELLSRDTAARPRRPIPRQDRPAEPTVRAEPVPEPARAEPRKSQHRAAQSHAAQPRPPQPRAAQPHAAAAQDAKARHGGKPDPKSLPLPKPRAIPETEQNVLTSELEPICDDVKRLRAMDNTLARFSAVHDELAEEERRKRSKRSRFLPWVSEADELEEALTFTPTKVGVQPVDPAELEDEQDLAEEEPEDAGELAEDGLDEAGYAEDLDEAEYAEDPEDRERPRMTRLREKKQRRTEQSVVAGKVTAGAVSALVLLGCGIGWGIQGGQGGAEQGKQVRVVDHVESCDRPGCR
ncbi:hypothetical protein [Sciscionella marina]|uniref:hypothetical protein n=1 Tax=Sciscionella marina TaxID=508770 RepID=UPI000399A313|nr:hypothetical protein [Sciscionella marina]